ncbi:MAG: serine hydrolase [Thermomicrobiales bacterium]
MFHRLWARTDLPIVEARTSRSWIWGEHSISPLVAEQNSDGTRLVQYFDKGGMQFNPDPVVQIGNPAFVMASPLAYELITGRLADGTQWEPSGISIAGDADDATGPTYATFKGLRDAPASADGALLTQFVDRQGTVSNDERLAQYGVTAAYHVQLPLLDHQIASPFWSFIQSSGMVYEAAQFREEPLFEDQWSMIGLPLTDAYWSQVKYAGRTDDVLVQVFERRVMTYNPAEPEGWQVQFANIGRHYVDWRYGGTVPAELAADPASLPQQARPNLDPLRTELADMLASEPGAQAVTVLDIQTGETVSVNGDQRYLAACTIKIPIMIAVARDITAGKYTAADVQHLVLPAMGPSLTWPARELLRITGDGDVGAGVHRANAIMESYGVERSLMTHAPGYWGDEYGYLASDGEVENWLTTDDLAKLLAGIWNGDGLTPAERNYVLWSLTLATPFPGRHLPRASSCRRVVVS